MNGNGDKMVAAKVRIALPQSQHNIQFFGKDPSVEIGCLYWDDGVMRFRGMIDQSAQIFSNYLLDTLINPYIKKKLKDRK
tara:strand:+ start:688 stop:927 length:240 start_codon:yes stop_codon:yes gene_type:complete